MYAKPKSERAQSVVGQQNLIAYLMRAGTKIKLSIFRRSYFTLNGIFPRYGANIFDTKWATDFMQGDQACEGWKDGCFNLI